MFRRIFGSNNERAADQAETALTTAATTAGDTATVRRIVARLEAMPAEQARFIASAAYTLARAANADMDISDDETAEIEHALQENGAVDEATAILVTEMAKLQSRTVGGTEDYVVTREFRNLASESQRLDILRACYAISAASGSISAEENAVVNEIARELDLDTAAVNSVRSAYHDRLSAVQEVRRIAGTETGEAG
jgi:tellurite resistance protein